jgi:hypothetical protein
MRVLSANGPIACSPSTSSPTSAAISPKSASK